MSYDKTRKHFWTLPSILNLYLISKYWIKNLIYWIKNVYIPMPMLCFLNDGFVFLDFVITWRCAASNTAIGHYGRRCYKTRFSCDILRGLSEPVQVTNWQAWWACDADDCISVRHHFIFRSHLFIHEMQSLVWYIIWTLQL